MGAAVGALETGAAVIGLSIGGTVGTFGTGAAVGAFGIAVGAFETGAVVGALRLVAKGIKTLEKHPVNSLHKESAPSETTVTFHMKVLAN
jgi:hypothetical protein